MRRRSKGSSARAKGGYENLSPLRCVNDDDDEDDDDAEDTEDDDAGNDDGDRGIDDN